MIIIKKQKAILLILFIVIALFSSINIVLTQEPVIDGNTVYINNSNCYIAVSPHTITDSGYIYLNVTSKTFSGNIDFAFGFINSYFKPKTIEYYNPRNIEEIKKVNLNSYWDNPSYDIEYNYTSVDMPYVYNGYITVNNTVNNIMEFSHSFNYANTITKEVYWIVNKYTIWHEITNKLEFEKYNINAEGMNTWFVSKEMAINEDVEYYLRVYCEVTPSFNSKDFKYCVAFKRSSQTIQEAIQNNSFYVLDPWYNLSWGYRKSHIISQLSGASTNYQINITCMYGSGSDSGNTVYLSSHSQTDFDDIRFTDNDETTLLDYWREEYTVSTSAVFWVELSDNLGSGDVTIYVYYGNDAVSTTSSGDDTFLFFDDFEDETEGNPPDTNKWYIVGEGDLDASNKVEILTVSGDKVLYHKESGDNVYNYARSYDLWDGNCSIGTYGYFDTGNNDEYYYYANENSTTGGWTIRKQGTSKDLEFYQGGYIDTGENLEQDTWYKTEWQMSSFSEGAMYLDNSLVEEDGYRTDPTTTVDNIRPWIILKTHQAEVYINDVFVRRFVSPDVTHSTWGSEEESPTPHYYVEVFYSVGGVLGINHTYTYTNGSITEFDENDKLNLTGVSLNSTYYFVSINWSLPSTSNSSVVNFYEWTMQDENDTIWCYFNEVSSEADYTGYIEEEYLALLFAVFIGAGVLIIVIYLNDKEKR